MNRSPFGQSILPLGSAFLFVLMMSLVAHAEPPAEGNGQAKAGQPANKHPANWKPGEWKPLKGSWHICQFGGEGPVEVKDELIKIGLGDPISGIQWEGEVPRENYEVELEARRTDGYDFFCGLTFPVGKDHVSLVLGGWGGGVVGISSVDGYDASENETTMFRNFDNGKWYKVRARVDAAEIRCWIDDKEVVEQPRKGHNFDIRFEMDLCVPLGVANYQCDSELRNIRLRKLTNKEIAEANQKVEQASDGSSD